MSIQKRAKYGLKRRLVFICLLRGGSG